MPGGDDSHSAAEFYVATNALRQAQIRVTAQNYADGKESIHRSHASSIGAMACVL
jgi:hypothetical protein